MENAMKYQIYQFYISDKLVSGSSYYRIERGYWTLDYDQFVYKLNKRQHINFHDIHIYNDDNQLIENYIDEYTPIEIYNTFCGSQQTGMLSTTQMARLVFKGLGNSNLSTWLDYNRYKLPSSQTCTIFKFNCDTESNLPLAEEYGYNNENEQLKCPKDIVKMAGAQGREFVLKPHNLFTPVNTMFPIESLVYNVSELRNGLSTQLPEMSQLNNVYLDIKLPQSYKQQLGLYGNIYFRSNHTTHTIETWLYADNWIKLN